MSESKTVIITGAARGIGAVIAARFVRDGATVYGIDRAFEEPPVGFAGITADITRTAEVRDAIEFIRARHERIDVLVNNAGVNLTGPLDAIDLDEVAHCLSVNVVALLRMCQAVIPTMKAHGAGRIVNAASFAAITPAIGSGVYAASKAAVVQLTRVLAGELGPWNITANAYAPGMVPTSMNGFADLVEAEQSLLLDTLSLRRWGAAEEVADLVAYLSGDSAGYITGTLVDVSGGKLATQMPWRAYRSAEAED